MDYTDVSGKKIALLVWNLEEENDAHVYIGEIIKTDEGFKFTNKSKNWYLTIDEELFSRLKEVSDEAKDIFLNSDFYLSCSIASLPEDSDRETFFTGMKWH